MEKQIQKVRVHCLKQHPENKRIYNTISTEPLKESIDLYGLLQRIIVNKKMQILCGWRRLLAINELGWDEVEVTIVDVPEDEEAAFMVFSNAQRQKTTVEIYHELKVLKEYWAKKQGTRTDLDPELSAEEKKPTRTRIAEAIGVSESKIYRIESVGDKDIKMLELVDLEKIESLSEAFNACKQDKSVHEKDIVEIDLTQMKLCPTCGCLPRRIVKDENGNLTYSIL